MNIDKLVLDYKNGNEKAFNKIYEVTVDMVKCAIVTYVKDRDTVLDLCQDTYMAFCSNIDKYDSKSFYNWLYTIAKNKAIDVLSEEVFTLYKDIETQEITRMFLYNGYMYLP